METKECGERGEGGEQCFKKKEERKASTVHARKLYRANKIGSRHWCDYIKLWLLEAEAVSVTPSCSGAAGCLGHGAAEFRSLSEPRWGVFCAGGGKPGWVLMQQISGRLGNRAGLLISSCSVCRSAGMLLPHWYSSSETDFASLQLTLFACILVTQSLDLLTKTRTLYFKTSSASCTTGRNQNINEVNSNLSCQNHFFREWMLEETDVCTDAAFAGCAMHVNKCSALGSELCRIWFFRIKSLVWWVCSDLTFNWTEFKVWVWKQPIVQSR